MRLLSELQRDSLSEVFNIGAGRAASSLSEIVGEEIKLSVPCLRVLHPSEINLEFLSLSSMRLGAVKQHFSGPFSADAMLLFTEDRTLEIVRDMMGSQISLDELADFEEEAMCELGNIILNACLSAMADILELSLESSLPVYSVDSSEAILQQIIASGNEPIILFLHINMEIERRRSQGYLVFLLSSTSLDTLLEHIDRFLAVI
ncbi:MAG: chemotaxis protein CheC [Betaproteobacteria bacterium]|nr:chemotaxis protein CheC [Betaproteobacteria bacterium]